MHAVAPFPLGTVEVSTTVNTGIAWTREADVTFDMLATLWLSDSSGTRIYGVKTIPYSGHDARFIDQIFPELHGSGFKGFLKIESQREVLVEVLRMDTVENGILFTSTPPNTVVWQ